ncbi:terpene synthase family protein [Embleya sp. AB8]|uniref:terpene synthase family protein n=1 Tax=Embleya sp. AB8 TaxID=3156304 RepID=UPI003C78D226
MFCPLPGALNPAVLDVERQALAWADEIGLTADARSRARLAGTRAAEFFARCAPHASAERLLPCVLWTYWGFAFDDARCDNGPLSSDPAGFLVAADRAQRALVRGSAEPDADRFETAVADIGRRLRAGADPDALLTRRFAHANRAWLGGVAEQITNRAQGYVPDLDSYVAMRLHSAGGGPTCALLEYAHGEPMSEAEAGAPAVRAATEAAILAAALDNDRQSAARETNDGQGDQNVYGVLRVRHGLTAAEAVDRATRLRDGALSVFLRLRDRARPDLGPAGRAYLDGLAHTIRGNAEWGAAVPRYTTADATPAPGPRWTDTPTDPGLRPPPEVPSIVWWWRVLG